MHVFLPVFLTYHGIFSFIFQLDRWNPSPNFLTPSARIQSRMSDNRCSNQRTRYHFFSCRLHFSSDFLSDSRVVASQQSETNCSHSRSYAPQLASGDTISASSRLNAAALAKPAYEDSQSITLPSAAFIAFIVTLSGLAIMIAVVSASRTTLSFDV